jgi:hypothetical protein
MFLCLFGIWFFSFRVPHKSVVIVDVAKKEEGASSTPSNLGQPSVLAVDLKRKNISLNASY